MLALLDPSHHYTNTPQYPAREMQKNMEKSQGTQAEAILNKPAPRWLTDDCKFMSETRQDQKNCSTHSLTQNQ